MMCDDFFDVDVMCGLEVRRRGRTCLPYRSIQSTGSLDRVEGHGFFFSACVEMQCVFKMHVSSLRVRFKREAFIHSFLAAAHGRHRPA